MAENDSNSASAIVPVEYRDVPNFPGYRVGDDGSVWSCKSGSWAELKRTSSHHGYVRVNLHRTGKHTRKIHRLILEAFVGPCPAGMEACHANGLPADNRLVNLRWGTSAENKADMKRHGTQTFGENHPPAKLTKTQVDYIRSEHALGATGRSLAKKFSVSAQTVSAILSRRIWVA